MSKGTKNSKSGLEGKKAGKFKLSSRDISPSFEQPHNNYLYHMSHAPRIEESSSIFQMLPIFFSAAIIIMITRMASYQRPMSQFFWSSNENNLTDFFSYYKMAAIVACAVVMMIFLLYRIFIQALSIKKSAAYIPMLIYTVLVLLSYAFSDYKLFALWGWNDRFEGTVTLICYMVILFYIINTVNSETNVKWLIYVLGGTSTLLGLLGLTQALGHDFFRTVLGKKMITPSWFWDNIDSLNFTFKNQEIYQTVYNINYVSFYLTLLIPLFGLLFIRSVMKGKEEPLIKKLAWGALFTLLIYNLIGSASSSGLMGMAFVVLLAVIILNKRILLWWKPVAILLVITAVVAGVTQDRWFPELNNAIGGVIGSEETTSGADSETASVEKHKIEFITTSDQKIILGYKGEELIITTFADDPSSIELNDSAGNKLTAIPTSGSNVFQVDDQRFSWITVQPAEDDSNNHYIVLTTDEKDWAFQLTESGPKYYNELGKLVTLTKTPYIGWENNPNFGNGRGYIWSRTLPMMKDTILLGHGADTYCIYYPHQDYIGKYNADWMINMVVDKPHNMFMGIFIGTGGLSLLALLTLWCGYLIQSFMIYRRESFDSFISFAGVGIFLGIFGFLTAGVVNDSSVSVMPMFYGLLGSGISINMIIKRSAHR